MVQLSERELFTIRRRRAGLTMAEIARNIGCSRSLLSRFERNQVNLGPILEQQYKRFIDQHCRALTSANSQ